MSQSKNLFDVRAIERNLKHGLINHSDVAKHLAGLPDVAHKGISLGEVEDRRAERTSAAAQRREAAPAPAPAAPAPAPATPAPAPAAPPFDPDPSSF